MDGGLIVEIAGRYGVPVACEHVAISAEQAQRQAVQRMIAAHGRLLEPEEMNSKGKTDRGFAARAGCGYLDASTGLATVKVPSLAAMPDSTQ